MPDDQLPAPRSPSAPGHESEAAGTDDATVISSADRGGASSEWHQRRPPAGSATGRSATTEIGRLLEGTMLGPYRLDRFIGGGGMGAVFQALDTTLHRTVAIKVLARQQSDDEENLRRFRNEAQSAARLDHENIGRIYAVGSDGGWHYIVLEYIEGTNLRDLVREEGPFDPGRTVDVAIQVAEALEHASERDVVHRDIKPSNIVITPAGRARIVDMGLARLHQVSGDAELTVSGMTLGTFDYISPEQARDPRAADVRSDLYSLGCTMFFLLTGRPPFAEGTMVQKLLQHQQVEPPAVDDIRPDVPRRVAAVIARLMEKDPVDRYQRPAVLVADLFAVADAEGFQLSARRSPAPENVGLRQAGSLLPWLVPVLLLAAVVAGLWLRSAGIRGTSDGPQRPGRIGPPSVASQVPAGTAGTEPAAIRMVSNAGALTAAIAGGADGEIIEIDTSGRLDVGPFSVAGRRLTIRAAPGQEPVLRISSGDDGVAVTIGDGSLTLRGVGLDEAGGTRPSAGRRSLFAIAGGKLVCEALVLRMASPRRPWSTVPEVSAFVQVLDQAAPGSAAETALDFLGVRVAGDANLLDVQTQRGGRVTFRWDSGAALTKRLVAAEGTRTGDLLIMASLTDVIAACSDALVTLRDSPGQPRIAAIEMQASGCRFVVADQSRPFVEQVGIAEPEAYLAALAWRDRHSRYEGSPIFQRIDGAAERVQLAFGQPNVPLVHDFRVAPLPDPADWVGGAEE